MRISKNIYCLVFIVFYIQSISAQTQDTLVYRTSNLILGYNSSIKYPGIRTGFEAPIKATNTIKTKKSGKKKEFNKDQFLTAKLSWYHHPTFHENVFLTVGWIYRCSNVKGFLYMIFH